MQAATVCKLSCGRRDILKKSEKALFYIFSRLAAAVLVVGIIIGAFVSSMKTSNVYFLLNDALTARLDVILLGKDIEDKSKFFSYNYLQGMEYSPLKDNYSIYLISNYGHKFEYSNLFVFPWQRTKTVTVKEAVFAISGELDTTKMSKADALAHGMYNVPEWKNTVYSVKLVFSEGSWQIDSIREKGEYNYEPAKTPSLTKAEIEALRTPTPAPTPTPDLDSKVEGERSAVITSAFTGGTANLREGPSTVYKILGVLKRGDRITVIEESDDWYLIRTEDGTEGYVSGYYVSFE